MPPLSIPIPQAPAEPQDGPPPWDPTPECPNCEERVWAPGCIQYDPTVGCLLVRIKVVRGNPTTSYHRDTYGGSEHDGSLHRYATCLQKGAQR